MKKSIIIVLAFMPILLFSQNSFTFNHSWHNDYQKEYHCLDSTSHTSLKANFNFGQNTDSNIEPYSFKSSFLNGALNNNALRYQADDFDLIINPLFHLELGNSDSASRYVNTRAFEVKGRVGSKITFYTSFYENQAIFPDYLEDAIVDNYFVVPGQGYSKWGDHEVDHDFDFAMSNGLISYQADKHFNLQFGHGKNFIGDGYRSLLLSDNAFNYPFFKITTDFWKVKYVNIFSILQDLRPEFELNNTFRKKYSTTHYLSINLTKRWNLGLFETIVWEQSESGRGFDINYLNPIIFYRPVEFSLGSASGNALLGLNTKFKLNNSAHLYGQLLLDEFRFSELKAKSGWWANKYSYQLGAKWFDAFGVKNLTLQSEYNFSRPFTYSHLNPLQSYTHYNQGLAHPLGASFMESVSFLRYRYKRWAIDSKVIFATHGANITGDPLNYGSDILTSYAEGDRLEYGNEVAQGNTTNLRIVDVRLAYIVNTTTNMKVELGVTNRESKSLYLPIAKTNYVFISFKTDINNHYYDF